MVSRRSQLAVAVVIFALLAFTTIHTSPLSTGLEPGSSLSKTTPKQRHLSVKEIAWVFPVLSQLAFISCEYDVAVPLELDEFIPERLAGRYFNRPPPIA
jgi:hypothetical protein